MSVYTIPFPFFLKEIEKVKGMPIYQQRVIHNGHQLPDEKEARSKTIGDCGIGDNSTLYLLGRLRGG